MRRQNIVNESRAISQPEDTAGTFHKPRFHGRIASSSLTNSHLINYNYGKIKWLFEVK
jgi:hypothetical protein